MIVSAGDSGWSAHCFRCGNGFKPYPAPSLQETLDRLRKQQLHDAVARLTAELPMPAVADVVAWPVPAKLWLYKAGFTVQEIQEHGWYWCPKLHRVVLPVAEAGRVVFWNARNCTDKERPKYLAPEVDRASIVAAYGQGNVLVLTEDMLSAAKVGRHTAAWSLLGTKMPDPVLARILREGKPVVVWLDPDAAGISNAAKITNVLRSVGVKVCNVQTERDPKLHCNQEIQHVLSSCAFH